MKPKIDLERIKIEILILKVTLEEQTEAVFHKNDVPALLKSGIDLITALEEARKIIHAYGRVETSRGEVVVPESCRNWLEQFEENRK